MQPTQGQYRSTDEWTLYRANLDRIRKHPRPDLDQSRGTQFVKNPATYGFNVFQYIDPEGKCTPA